MSEANKQGESDLGSSHGSVALSVEPGLYWATEFSRRPNGRSELKENRIVEVSGESPWLRMKKIYPLPVNEDPALDMFEIIGRLTCLE